MFASMGFWVDHDAQGRDLPMQRLMADHLERVPGHVSLSRPLHYVPHSCSPPKCCIPEPCLVFLCWLHLACCFAWFKDMCRNNVLVERKHSSGPKAWGASFFTNHFPHSRNSSALIHPLSETLGTMFWGKSMCHSTQPFTLKDNYHWTALNTINMVVVSPF